MCIIPGLIAMLALWPAFLLVMEDDLGPVEAIKGAWALTSGYKIDLLVLGLSTMCLAIAGLLACCIGLVVAGPVMELTWVGAYHEMRMASGAVAVATPSPAAEPSAGLPPPPAMGPGDDMHDEEGEPTIEEPIGD